MKLKIKKIHKDAVLPVRATEYSAGIDLFAFTDNPVTIKKGETVKIHTGICVQPEDMNTVLLMYARSGLAVKYGISLANCVGVIDSDYRGEIIVPLTNNSDNDFTVEPAMRIAQLVVTPLIIPEIIEADSLSETERGKGGFGSTGI